jgi:hypothetical protein
MKKILLILFLAFSFSNFAYAEDAGFVPGTIWFSPKEFVEGDDVAIYTVLWNGNDSAISLKVQFMDEDTILGTRNVVIKPNTVLDVSINWKVTTGDHNISAKISPVEGSDLNLTQNEVKASPIFVPSKVAKEVVSAEVDEIKNKVVDAIPESVKEPIAEATQEIDDFRLDTHSEIKEAVASTKEKIEKLSLIEEGSNTENQSTDSLSSTEKPIAYVELFFLQIAFFIFGNKIVFYVVSGLILFLILRAIYRKVRK